MTEAIDLFKAKAFIKRIENRFLFRFFLWVKLPVAFWCGVKLIHIDLSKSITTVPFKRLTQNPFKSTYFACLAMAAELSTGIFPLIAIQAATKKVSMLVVKLEAEYFKKATSITYFTCADGEKIFKAIEQTITTGKAVTIMCESVGKNAQDELVAKFFLTWSFKVKS
ncbi:MAG: thioesterase [Bacteroidia bacterium]